MGYFLFCALQTDPLNAQSHIPSVGRYTKHLSNEKLDLYGRQKKAVHETLCRPLA